MNPPDGSKIKMELERGFTRIVMPHAPGGPMRYAMAVFMTAWLGGWAVGWVAATTALLKGTAKGGGGIFLGFWLLFWTVGGVFAIITLYRLLRPSIPEVLLLVRPGLLLDTGMPPFNMSNVYRSRMDAWKNMLRKREQVTFSPEDIRTLSLREFDTGNRVTIDQGTKRYDLGQGLSEPEREWLYRMLCEEYKLVQLAARTR